MFRGPNIVAAGLLLVLDGPTMSFSFIPPVHGGATVEDCLWLACSFRNTSSG